MPINIESNPVRVLLIDDEADSLLPTLAQNLEPGGFTFEKESSAAHAVNSVETSQPDVVLLDLHFPGDDRYGDSTTGGKLLSEIRRRYASIPVVVFTTRLDDADIPLEAFEEQPHGRFAKPSFSAGVAWVPALARAMRDAIAVAHASTDPNPDDLGFFVGETNEMRAVAGLVRTAATNNLNVLIYGESGTGKQLVAEAIHRLSERKGRFEQLNCAGIDENTLEARLFGYVRGAYTGANPAGAAGVFEIADGGTIYLDEIQRMPMALQDKLMLVIENHKVRRMGTNAEKKIDARVIVATNHSLSDLVADGLLREDLAYRFSVLLISLPPLRRRLGDLTHLFPIFVNKATAALNRHVHTMLRPETLAMLRSHSWPGNIRDLENTITRAIATSHSNILLPEHFNLLSFSGGRTAAQSPVHAEDEAIAAEDPASLPGTTAASPRDAREQDPAVRILVERLESLPIEKRYAFLVDQGEELRAAILAEFICRLRSSTGKRIQHKTLAAALDPLSNGEKDLAKIRQFVCSCVQLTQLKCNQ